MNHQKNGKVVIAKNIKMAALSTKFRNFFNFKNLNLENLGTLNNESYFFKRLLLFFEGLLQFQSQNKVIYIF